MSIHENPDYLKVIVYGYSYFMDNKANFMYPGFETKKKSIPRQTTKDKAKFGRMLGFNLALSS